MWKVHRYYLTELSASAALTFVVLFGIVLLSTVNRGLDNARGFGLIAATWIMLYWAADSLPHLIAMSLLFSTVLVFARASQDRELTALLSAGISPRVAMAPALLLGVMFSAAGSWAQHYSLPWVHFEKYHVVTEEIRQVMLNAGLVEDRLKFGDFVMTWQRQNQDDDWENVYLKLGDDDDANRLSAGVYRARLASLAIEREHDELALTLYDLERPGSDFYLEEFVFRVNLRALSDKDRRHESDRDLSSDTLLAEVARGQHDNANGARFTVHRRSCFALMPFLFAPIAFCIGVLSRARGRVLALVFAMVPLGVYYTCDVISAKLVRVVDWPPIAFLPAVVLVAGGAPFCWRLLRI